MEGGREGREGGREGGERGGREGGREGGEKLTSQMEYFGSCRTVHSPQLAVWKAQQQSPRQGLCQDSAGGVITHTCTPSTCTNMPTYPHTNSDLGLPRLNSFTILPM